MRNVVNQDKNEQIETLEILQSIFSNKDFSYICDFTNLLALLRWGMPTDL